MITQIPTYVIAGALGAGKTRFIQDVLAQKPAHERWAVLINEFGQIGLDAALLANSQAGVSITEVAGGCLCCVNGVPFQVALTQLLRRSKPHRLLIEPSGLAHPQALLEQLHQAPWQTVLKVQAPVLVLDASRPDTLTEQQQAFLSTAQHLVLSKAEQLSLAEREQLSASFTGKHIHWRMLEPLPLDWFAANTTYGDVDNTLNEVLTVPKNTLWISKQEPLFSSHQASEGIALGWRWHPSLRFSLAQLEALVAELNAVRSKLVIHSEQGWVSCNVIQAQPPHWQPSAWRNDSRMEWIFTKAVDKKTVEEALRGCVLPSF